VVRLHNRLYSHSPHEGTYIRPHAAVPTSQQLHACLVLLPSRKRWVRSRATCARTIRFYLESPAISSSESSLLEERTPARPPYCSESVTQRRVQKSIGMMQREIASWYVLVPDSMLNLIVQPGSTRPYDRGRTVLFLSVTTDREDLLTAWHT
jgi:hypothetical protein